MTTEIISNGSNWAGEAPDSIATLLDALGTYALDRRFLAYSPCCYVFTSRDGDGTRRFWGNFAEVSHVFDIKSDDPAVCRALTLGIRDNLRRHRRSDPRFAPCPEGHRAREEQRRRERHDRQIYKLRNRLA